MILFFVLNNKVSLIQKSCRVGLAPSGYSLKDDIELNAGIYKEDSAQLKATYDLWKGLNIFKNADVNPEYDQFS